MTDTPPEPMPVRPYDGDDPQVRPFTGTNPPPRPYDEEPDQEEEPA